MVHTYFCNSQSILIVRDISANMHKLPLRTLKNYCQPIDQAMRLPWSRSTLKHLNSQRYQHILFISCKLKQKIPMCNENTLTADKIKFAGLIFT